jgi:hypothetical protein
MRLTAIAKLHKPLAMQAEHFSEVKTWISDRSTRIQTDMCQSWVSFLPAGHVLVAEPLRILFKDRQDKGLFGSNGLINVQYDLSRL